jgi:hypothetical protein
MKSKRSAKQSTAAGPGAVEPAHDENWDQRLGFLMHDVSRMRRNVFEASEGHSVAMVGSSLLVTA